MLDQNGNEIKVGVVVRFKSGTIGTVSNVSEDSYTCNGWDDNSENGIDFVHSEYNTIIKSSATNKSLQQLKAPVPR